MPDMEYEDASGDRWEASLGVYLPYDLYIKWNEHEHQMVPAARWLYYIYRNDERVGMVALPKRLDRQDPKQAAEFAAEIIPAYLRN